jgi:predicted amidohydrolase YtcJ
VNAAFDTAQAMVIRSGKIISTGNTELLRKKYSAAEELDCGGKAVYPGFIDPHCHFYNYGLSLRHADLTGTGSPEEIIAKLREIPVTRSSWVLGRGWDQNDWGKKEFPDKTILDKVFPDNPVCLVRIDGHAAWVNSRALAMAGINGPVNLRGGEVIADNNGPTGILLDNAMSLVEKIIPEAEGEERVMSLLRAQKNCFEVGLTLVGDAGLDRNTVLLLDSLQLQGQLKMRIYAMLNPDTNNTEHFINRGIYRTSRLSVRSVKLFADGALGSRGALLLNPYSDNPITNGIQVSSEEELMRICALALEKGYQVNTHCIGDSAVRLMLMIYSRFLPEKNDLRWRIEHAQVVNPDDMSLFGKYNIIPSIQTTHATSDMYWAEKRLGPERILHAYAYQSLLQQNGWLANGSDFPVESINPLYGFYAAVFRKDLQGYPPGGFRPEEGLSRPEALKAMTIWAARACMEDSYTGSLEAGKVADFVILNTDIMLAGPTDIAAAKVLYTYVDGKRVYFNEN